MGGGGRTLSEHVPGDGADKLFWGYASKEPSGFVDQLHD